MKLLTGRVALVTGSSKGIGAAIAREFAREGASVAVHGRDEAAARGVAEAIAAEGGQAISVLGDVTDFAQVEAIRGQIEDRCGPVDVLVANAGGNFAPPAALEEITEQAWQATVNGNLLATFLKPGPPSRTARRRLALPC